MAYTADDIVALKRAIASGARVVRYRSGSVEYRSLSEMREILEIMEAEVHGKKPRRTLAVYRSGA